MAGFFPVGDTWGHLCLFCQFITSFFKRTIQGIMMSRILTSLKRIQALPESNQLAVNFSSYAEFALMSKVDMHVEYC